MTTYLIEWMKRDDGIRVNVEKKNLIESWMSFNNIDNAKTWANQIMNQLTDAGHTVRFYCNEEDLT